jgi:hypothetical protein
LNADDLHEFWQVLEELVALDTTAPVSEQKLVEVERVLRPFGCCRVGRRLLGAGDPTERMWTYTHVDTKPAGDRQRWRTNPFRLTVDQDRWLGLGVLGRVSQPEPDQPPAHVKATIGFLYPTGPTASRPICRYLLEGPGWRDPDERNVPVPVDSYVVGLDPLPGLEQDPAATILERESRAVLLRVASSEAPRIRQHFASAVHVYASEKSARQVWTLFTKD